jgi:hypothetical protein
MILLHLAHRLSPSVVRSSGYESSNELYIHVTVHRNRFLFKKPTRRTNYPNLFCHKTLHVSGNFLTHHQELSTVHSALVNFIQVFDDRFQAESGWNAGPSWLCLEAVIKNLHKTYQCRMYSRKFHDDGQRRCPKLVEFYNRINLDNWCVCLVI